MTEASNNKTKGIKNRKKNIKSNSQTYLLLIRNQLIIHHNHSHLNALISQRIVC